MDAFHWLDHVLFFLVGVLFPINALRSAQPQLAKIRHWDSPMKRMLYISNSLMLLGMALVVVLVWYFTGKPLSALGFQLPITGSWTPALIYATLFLVIYLSDIYIETRSHQALERTYAHLRKHTPFMPENWREMQPFYFLIFGAAVGEEIVFRGFILSYILHWFEGFQYANYAAIILSSALFAIVHLYQGWKAVGKIAALSGLFAILFLVTESLLIPIILHFIIDWLGGYFSIVIHQRLKPHISPFFSEEEE